MVCIYCGGATQVANSRLQKKSNNIWRRRRCLTCSAIFTSQERASYSQSLALQTGTSHIVPFERDLLFLSVHDACRHRPHPAADAAALTETAIAALLRNSVSQGLIKRDDVVITTSTVLKRFDTIACVQYLAVHALRPAATY